MTATFLEFSRPTMMPGGGVANSGESIGFDSVAQAAFISTVLASGAAVAGSAPGAYVLPALTRVKIVASFIPVGAPIYNAGVFVGVSPATFFAGDITGLSTAIAAALIASGQAVANSNKKAALRKKRARYVAPAGLKAILKAAGKRLPRKVSRGLSKEEGQEK